MAESINTIIDLIKQGDRTKARTELIALVRQQTNDERVWFLLSLVLDEPEQQRDSLLRVLEINPDNEDAQRRLISLGGTPAAVPEPEAPAPPEVEPPIAEPAAAPEFMEPEINAVPETPADSSESGSIPWLDQGADAEAGRVPEAQPVAGEVESPAWMEPSSEPEPARAEPEAATDTPDWQPVGNEEIETPDWMSSSSSAEEETETPDWMSPASSAVEAAETPDRMSPATAAATEDSETPAWMEPTADDAPAEMPWDVSTIEQPEEAAAPATPEVEDSADTDLPWNLPTPSESQPGELPDWGDDDGSDDDSWMDMPSSRLDFGTEAADLESEAAPAVGSDTPESGLLTTEKEPEVAAAPDLSGADSDEVGIENIDAGEVTLATLRERSRQREIPESERERPRSRKILRTLLLTLATLGLLAVALGFGAIQFEIIPPPPVLAGILPIPGLLSEQPAVVAVVEDPTPTLSSEPAATPTDTVNFFPTLPPVWTTTPVPIPTETPVPTTTPSPEPTETPRFSVSLPGGLIVFTGHAAGASLDSLETLANLFAIDAPNTLDFIPATTGEGSENPPRPLTLDEDGQQLAPSASIDTETIVWASSATGDFDIFSSALPDLLDDPAAARNKLTSAAALDLEPAISSTGELIVFTSDRDTGTFQLYLMNVDGSELQPLTSGEGNNIEPSWSGDSTEIVFASDRNGNFDIFVFSVAEGTTEQLTFDPASDRLPAFSPSGDSIAFVSERDGNQDVYIMVADGRDQINVTFDPGVDTEPAWSEEGDWIVFSTNRDGNFELYLLSVAQVTFHRLTDTPVFDERMPYWHP